MEACKPLLRFRDPRDLLDHRDLLDPKDHRDLLDPKDLWGHKDHRDLEVCPDPLYVRSLLFRLSGFVTAVLPGCFPEYLAPVP